MDTSKYVIMITSLVVMALLVGAVFLPVVSSSTTRTITTEIENEEPGWLKCAYSESDDYSFGISIEDDTLSIGSQTLGIQTGELYDMMVLSTDALVIVIDGDSIVAVSEDGAVDLGTSVNVEKTSSVLTVGDTTYSAPLWSYYPDASGNYAYFDHANLEMYEAPLSAWGKFAGVYAYPGFTNPEVGLVMDATINEGVIEGVTWGTAPDTLDIQPFRPGDVDLQPIDLTPIDLNPIDVDLKPIDLAGGENQLMSADPTYGTRIGDLYYTFSGTDATVIGYASTIDWSTFTTIPDTVTNGGVTYYVTSIGGSAFYGCTSLALTSLPAGVTSIDSSAFYGCTSLALTSLPAGVTSIGGSTFYNCTSLALTSLPAGVTSIGASAFYNCTSLALTSLPAGVTSILANTFYSCTNLALTSLPTGVTSISNSAFRNCTNLALTSLPTGVTSIASSAFENCRNLALTSLPSGITSISNSAFSGCRSINGIIEISENVTVVGNSAFKNCTGINTLVIKGDTSIGANAFENCTFDLVVLGNPTFNASSLQNATTSEVLNLGTSEITTTTGGMSADEIRNDITAKGYIAPESISITEVVTIDSPVVPLMNFLPLVAGIGLLMVGLAMFITRRT